MTNDTGFPLIESHLPEMTAFVSGLAQDYRSGDIQSWEMMAERVHAFFTPDMLDKVDAVAPGWRDMSSYANGATLVHVMCVFTGLLACPEFQHVSNTEQELMKWIVLFHDIAKEVRDGQRDYTHGFRSAARTGAILPRVGFPVTTEYDRLFTEWFTLANTAITKRGKTTVYIHDNRKLPEIIDGIERLFGHDTPAALIVKTVLLHYSIDVVDEWPQVAPLTEIEIRQYLDIELFPLLKMMMLADNDGWALFDPPTKERYRQETLAVFGKLEPIFGV
jgi:hypothetical protein